MWDMYNQENVPCKKFGENFSVCVIFITEVHIINVRQVGNQMQDVRFKVYERKLRCIFPPIFNVHCTLKYKQQEHLVCLHISPHCICQPCSRFPTHGRHGSSLTSSLLPSLLWLMKGLYVWDDTIRGLTAEMHLTTHIIWPNFHLPHHQENQKIRIQCLLKVWLVHSFGSRPRLFFWCPNILWKGRGELDISNKTRPKNW